MQSENFYAKDKEDILLQTHTSLGKQFFKMSGMPTLSGFY